MTIVRAKKLAALLLASSYFLSVACRFSCAETLARGAEAAPDHALATSGEPACVHCPAPAGRSRQTRPVAPCCRMGASASALVNPAVVAPSAARVDLGAFAANVVVIPQPLRRGFSSDPDPPRTTSSDRLPSSLSPRAPPSRLVVL